MPVTNTCDRCNGTGEYHGTRRDGSTYTGACFSCQPGGGARYRGRWNRSVPRPTPSESIVAPYTGRQRASLDAFGAAFPAESRWLTDNAPTNTFAASLLNGIARYGNLTPRQLAAVQRNLPAAPPAWDANAPVVNTPAEIAAASGMRPVAPAIVSDNLDASGTHRVTRFADGRVTLSPPPVDSLAALADSLAGDFLPAAPTPGFTAAAVDAAAAHVDRLNIAYGGTTVATVPGPAATRPVDPPVTIAASEMRTALLTARNSGLRRPRLTLGLYEFRLGRTGTARASDIFVYVRPGITSSAWSYAGSIKADDAFVRSYSLTLTAEQMELIRDAAANPRNSAAAHGHETTHCSCCRRLLTDPPSVMAGIGPVCITRFGWL